ncbi:hypothetical protein D3C73_185000 [compost metagenome]
MLIRVSLKNGNDFVAKIEGDNFESINKKLARDIFKNKIIATKDAVFRGSEVISVKEFR